MSFNASPSSFLEPRTPQTTYASRESMATDASAVGAAAAGKEQQLKDVVGVGDRSDDDDDDEEYTSERCWGCWQAMPRTRCRYCGKVKQSWAVM